MGRLRILLASGLIATCTLPAGFAAPPTGEISLTSLLSYWSVLESNYKVDPYIAAAGKLRAIGKDKAVKILRVAADDPKQSDDTVIALCRMLFTAKPKGEFRRPLIGAPACLGGTDLKTWLLEPIEIVDGVPFLVVDGYELGGRPESAKGYLDYCLRECDWGATEYNPKTPAEKKKALESLLSSKKWKKPLTDDEEAFLAAQIK